MGTYSTGTLIMLAESFLQLIDLQLRYMQNFNNFLWIKSCFWAKLC